MNHSKIKIITLMVVSMLFSLTVNAINTLPYDENELYTTLKDSFDFYTEFFLVGEEEFINYADTPIIIEREDGTITLSNTYYPRADALGNWNNFSDKLHSYYTDEIGDIFAKNMRAFEKSGKVYIQSSLCHPQTNDGPYFSYHDTVIDNYNSYKIDVETRETFKLIKSNENTLLFEFQVYDFWMDAGFADRPTPDKFVLNLTVEFTHTDDGWRISGGTVVDTYLYGRSYNYYINGAPQTGVDAVAYAAVAVVALAAAAVVVKKRRFV